MEQTFESILEAHEDTKIGNLGDVSMDDLTRLVFGRDVRCPRIVCQLFQTQCNSAAIDVDCQNFAFDLLTLLQHFAGVADLPRPGHIGNV